MKKVIVASIAAALAGAGIARSQTIAPLDVLPSNAAGAPLAYLAAPVPGAQSSRVWASGEYLLWWFRNSPLPVPVLTAAPGTTTASIPAALGNPDTTVVLGAHPIDLEERSGGRFTLGSWLDADQTIGAEIGYFFLPKRSSLQAVSSGGIPFLGVPFLDVTPAGLDITAPATLPGQNVNSLTFPGTVGGAVLRVSSSLQGAEADAVWQLANGDSLRLRLLGGFRYVNFQEKLSFDTTETTLAVVSPLSPVPGFENSRDEFDTRNDFYGGQLGVSAEYDLGRFFVGGTAKVGLGDMHEAVTINGNTTTNFAFPTGIGLLPTQTVSGGNYAQPTNIGHYTRDRFAVVPEVQVKVGYQVADWARLFVGYDFLYLSRVARPGEQINPVINTTQYVAFQGLPPMPLVGPAEPSFHFHDSSFWAQGISFGIEFRY